MYVPPQFNESRVEVMHQLMREHALGALVTCDGSGLNANHVPFDIACGPTQYGTLRAHVARSNPVWREPATESESLVIFQGAQAYISPSLYATKKEDGRVVPTYNYMVVHAYGRLRAVDDPAWVHALLERLTERHEAGRAAPWKVSDAPADYIDKLLSAVVGIEIEVTRLVGKWKVSQNQPLANRLSVEQGLRSEGGDASAAMSAAVVAGLPVRRG